MLHPGDLMLYLAVFKYDFDTTLSWLDNNFDFIAVG